jgi:hypothetical protein
MTISDDLKLGEARAWLLDQFEEYDKVRCPCCGKQIENYHRRVYGRPVRDMLKAYDLHDQNWFHWASTTGSHGGDGSKMEHWGIMQRANHSRDPDEPNVGNWRITDYGGLFLRNVIAVPACARVLGLGNQFRGWCDTKHPGEIKVEDAVGKGFDYQQLRGR